MKTKILVLIAAALLFAIPLLAIPPESDTVWTRNFGFSGRFEFVQNDEYIIMGGSTGIYRIRTSDGKVVNDYKLYTNFYTITPDREKMLLTGDFSFYTMELETGNIVDSILIEKTNEFKYVDGDTTNPWDETYLSTIVISPDNKYILCSWCRRGYRFNSYDPELIDTRTILVINTETKKYEREIEIVPNAICFSPDGNYLAIGIENDDISIIKLYSSKTFEFIKNVSYLEGLINYLEFSYDNKFICSIYNGTGLCKVINIENNEVVFPDINSTKHNFVKACFFNNKNLLLYSEWQQIGSKMITKLKEYNIETKEENTVFDDFGITWYYPGGFNISKNDNYILSYGYTETSYGNFVLIINNISKVYEIGEIYSKIRISPNPSENILFINFNDVNVKQLEIVDINGNSIFKEEINIEENSKVINTSTFLSGTYFLRITTNQEIETYKFAKE